MAENEGKQITKEVTMLSTCDVIPYSSHLQQATDNLELVNDLLDSVDAALHAYLKTMGPWCHDEEHLLRIRNSLDRLQLAQHDFEHIGQDIADET